MGSSISNTQNPETLKRQESVDGAIMNNCVVMFSTTTCKYCDKAKTLLSNMGVNFKSVELDLLGNNSFKVTSELTRKTGLRTVPQIFVNGKFVGGYTEIDNLKDAGKLMELVSQCANSRY